MSSIQDAGQLMLRNLMEQHRKSALYEALFGEDSKTFGKFVHQPDKIEHVAPYSCAFEKNIGIFSHTFHRNNTDIIKVKQIIIEYVGNPLSIGIDYIEIEIGGQSIIKIPYFIIEAFEPIKSYVTDAGKVVKIDFNLQRYINNIQLCILIYHDVKIYIKPTENSQIKGIQMICHSLFYYNEDRRRLAHSDLRLPIHQFEILNITSEEATTTHKFNMSYSRNNTINNPIYYNVNDGFSAASQGLFINSTSPIKSFKLVVNNTHTIINYDKYILEYIGKTYGLNNLLFIPFSVNFHLENSDVFNFNNYKNALPFSRVDAITATIETEHPTLGLQMASMSPNIHMYKTGMSGLWRAPNFMTNVKSQQNCL